MTNATSRHIHTIYIILDGPTGARSGRFPLFHDEQGSFVVLPGGKSGVKVRLLPGQIKAGKAFGDDYYCERPVQYTQTEDD